MSTTATTRSRPARTPTAACTSRRQQRRHPPGQQRQLVAREHHRERRLTPFHGGAGGMIVTDPADHPQGPAARLVQRRGAAGLVVLQQLLAGCGSEVVIGGDHPGLLRRAHAVHVGRRTNTNPSTRLAALRCRASSAVVGHSGELFDIGKSVHNLHISTTGTKTGGATLTYVQGGYAGEVQTSTSTGADQTSTFNSQRARSATPVAPTNRSPSTSRAPPRRLARRARDAGEAGYRRLADPRRRQGRGDPVALRRRDHLHPPLSGSEPNGLPRRSPASRSRSARTSAHTSARSSGATPAAPSR